MYLVRTIIIDVVLVATAIAIFTGLPFSWGEWKRELGREDTGQFGELR